MAIPDHVKRQAMSVISSPEIQAQIRLVKHTGSAEPGMSGPPSPGAEGSTPRQPIPERAKQEAKGVIGSSEIMQQIRLVEETGSPIPGATPSWDSHRRAQRSSHLHHKERDPDKAQKNMTKQDLGREYV
jgi:hypothetical protein